MENFQFTENMYKLWRETFTTKSKNSEPFYSEFKNNGKFPFHSEFNETVYLGFTLNILGN